MNRAADLTRPNDVPPTRWTKVDEKKAESNSTPVGLIFWLEFRRAEIRYRRQLRRH